MTPSPPGGAPPETTAADYHYSDPGLGYAHAYLLPELRHLMTRLADPADPVFEIGTGNGAVANEMFGMGYAVTGIETSTNGVAVAAASYPDVRIEQGSGYDDLAAKYGTFATVYSLEVIEHVYAPRLFLKRCFDLLRPGGWLILSTPYHGYLKNLVLALTGKMDDHFNVLTDNGHIKFWSPKTLGAVLAETGFTNIEFSRVGRLPPVASSMFAVAQRPPA